MDVQRREDGDKISLCNNVVGSGPVWSFRGRGGDDNVAIAEDVGGLARAVGEDVIRVGRGGVAERHEE